MLPSVERALWDAQMKLDAAWVEERPKDIVKVVHFHFSAPLPEGVETGIGPNAATPFHFLTKINEPAGKYGDRTLYGGELIVYRRDGSRSVMQMPQISFELAMQNAHVEYVA